MSCGDTQASLKASHKDAHKFDMSTKHITKAQHNFFSDWSITMTFFYVGLHFFNYYLRLVLNMYTFVVF